MLPWNGFTNRSPSFIEISLVLEKYRMKISYRSVDRPTRSRCIFRPHFLIFVFFIPMFLIQTKLTNFFLFFQKLYQRRHDYDLPLIRYHQEKTLPLVPWVEIFSRYNSTLFGGTTWQNNAKKKGCQQFFPEREISPQKDWNKFYEPGEKWSKKKKSRTSKNFKKTSHGKRRKTTAQLVFLLQTSSVIFIK